MPTNEKYLNLAFPLKGMDLNDEFEEQPPGTTPVGDNVRARDMLQLRLRGGQRPGMVKYVAQRIPEGPVLIQHLDYIVDPSAAALLQNFIEPGPTWIEDPNNPGTFVPPGGWGLQGGARFSGHAILEAVGEMDAFGDSSGTITNHQWTITIVFQPAFGDLDVDPGGNIGPICDNGTEATSWGSQNYTFQQLMTEAQLLQILKDQNYVAGGVTTGDVFISVTYTDIGPC